ncbi:phosphatase PAP2 family protein [Clostridium tyrobutyricum]|jgi:undecaprenyl-diphosphatase|nr:phosphatase PAP2 family protein [Clostridium tyrobutyricum]ANP68801.1 phosphatase [Clostridium tyrobutyricum]MBR9647215.1 phosphatase PAP2 family protein [Clostridium tyrobutyricum]MBV4416171.1 phosphatase PAP2 family protein [Clostridium tyrobutyricum]MBV4416228.1 phosphatase PAP2 family protein [Clostridium tyrobutyricum]MBV4422807.1 phosphatase PAP2 family protein [Clostridium tyrobutyricum]
MLMLQRFDIYILSIINKYLRNKYMDTFMCIMTKLGDMGAIWIAIAFILLLDKTYRYMGKMIIITLVASTVLGEGILKHLIKRLRPCNEKKDIELIIKKPVSLYSFPSGHTLSSFAVAGVLSTYFIQYELIFIVLASLIALSRIYLYVHYPTDVIGGIIIGLMCSKFILIFCN